ncbi:MAG: sugar phosphate isomerase/epimerase family protein [Cyclobacteriaceae bacterium]|jgi:sugar phosphate isomerase/epimerase
MKRREFLNISATSFAVAGFWPASAMKPRRKIGLQLYSLRDVIREDVPGLMKTLGSWGYQELEAYSYADGKLFGMTAKEFAKLAEDNGMRITSAHYGYGTAGGGTKGTVLNGWEQAVADAKACGQKYMVVPYLDKSVRDTLDGYKRVCEELNKAGEVCRKYGVRLQYHNHEFEFDVLEDKVPYQVMLRELDPDLVGFEMDLYWVVYAGHNPFLYFQQYPGRFEQWHVKDMDKVDRKRNADIGTGQIDFVKLFGAARQAGLKHFYIEQETYPVDSKTSVKNSIDNLRKLIG